MMTKTEIFYYLILFVYISLWICQQVACHLTHSLIILTESYINLYRILDISLGILHLRTQKALTKLDNQQQVETTNERREDNEKSHLDQSIAGKLFNSACTYQFKRLPLLGSFVNGIFLAALLMSAAIEGIQTCLHIGHSKNPDQKTILEESAHTYPLVLVGFALVSLIMQYCSMRAHEMREEELCSDSLMDLARLNALAASADEHQIHNQQECNSRDSQTVKIAISELNVNNLQSRDKKSAALEQTAKGKRRSYDLNSNSAQSQARMPATRSEQDMPLTIRSSEIAHDPDEAANRISLKSLKFPLNLGDVNSPTPTPVNSISNVLQTTTGQRKSISVTHHDYWFLVRYLTSPLALVACASIAYFANNELAKEVSDLVLAVTVVVLLFAASYPPMKRAGKILLQTAPDGVNLDRLEQDLKRLSAHVLEVRDLRVWSLTPRSNRVATCSLVLNKKQIENGQQVREIMAEARYRFIEQNIKCTTIEPIFEDRQQERAVN